MPQCPPNECPSPNGPSGRTPSGITLAGAWFLIACLLGSTPAWSETTDQVIAELRAELRTLNERLARIESRDSSRSSVSHAVGEGLPQFDYDSARQSAAPALPRPTAVMWYDTLNLEGDFRYRHEIIDAEFANDRQRQRIRARAHLTAKITDQVDVGLGLASGGDDPVSSNQTLGNGASTKDVRLDLAYAAWATPVDGLSLAGGKFKNPVHRAGGNALLWDSDFRPEGLTASFDRGALFAHAWGLWVEERSTDDDSIVFGGQVGWRGELRATHLLVGASYFDFDTKGQAIAFDGDPRGNSIDANGDYLYDYEEIEVFAELGFDVAGHPVTLFADYAYNNDADEFDTGYALGAKVEFDGGRHAWQLGYVYQDLEADAVFALFTDSDFSGGGTDGKGHILKGSYAITRQISLGGTLFVNERGGNAGVAEDYDRLQLDVSFTY